VFHCENHSFRTHDVLEISAKQLIAGHSSVPDWVERSLLAVPFAVIRRGPATKQYIPIGIRGAQRNQRWAAFCPPRLVKRLITPPQLLSYAMLPSRADDAPAFRALHVLRERWIDLDHPWGPGGGVGFELATGSKVVTPESDLDVVLYVQTRMTVEKAKSLCARAMYLPAVVDIQVETPVCGFSLREFARESPGAILMRSSCGAVIGTDPWGDGFI
jgi:phosphoribosyl-dephospho-CoA transferase